MIPNPFRRLRKSQLDGGARRRSPGPGPLGCPGTLTATLVLAERPERGRLRSRAVAARAGQAPNNHDRGALYLAALRACTLRLGKRVVLLNRLHPHYQLTNEHRCSVEPGCFGSLFWVPDSLLRPSPLALRPAGGSPATGPDKVAGATTGCPLRPGIEMPAAMAWRIAHSGWPCGLAGLGRFPAGIESCPRQSEVRRHDLRQGNLNSGDCLYGSVQALRRRAGRARPVSARRALRRFTNRPATGRRRRSASSSTGRC